MITEKGAMESPQKLSQSNSYRHPKLSIIKAAIVSSPYNQSLSIDKHKPGRHSHRFPVIDRSAEVNISTNVKWYEHLHNARFSAESTDCSVEELLKPLESLSPAKPTTVRQSIASSSGNRNKDSQGPPLDGSVVEKSFDSIVNYNPFVYVVPIPPTNQTIKPCPVHSPPSPRNDRPSSGNQEGSRKHSTNNLKRNSLSFSKSFIGISPNENVEKRVCTCIHRLSVQSPTKTRKKSLNHPDGSPQKRLSTSNISSPMKSSLMIMESTSPDQIIFPNVDSSISLEAAKMVVSSSYGSLKILPELNIQRK